MTPAQIASLAVPAILLVAVVGKLLWVGWHPWRTGIIKVTTDAVPEIPRGFWRMLDWWERH